MNCECRRTYPRFCRDCITARVEAIYWSREDFLKCRRCGWEMIDVCDKEHVCHRCGSWEKK